MAQNPITEQLIGEFMRKRDWQEAERLIRASGPFGTPMKCSWLVTCLENMGKGIDADRVIVRALEAFPESCTLHGQYARRLLARGETARATRHFSFMRRKWPGYEPAWCDEVKGLLSLNRAAEADALLPDMEKRFPQSMEIMRLGAEAATRRRQWDEALKRWEVFRNKFPSSPHGFRRANDIFMSQGKYDAVDALSRTMHPDAEAISGSCFIRRHPDSPDVLIIFAAFDIQPGFWPGGDNLFTPREFNANVIIVNDIYKRWYLDGIYGLGNDFVSAAKKIGELRDSLLGKGGHTVCYGNSMGAYGAFLYGSLIGADICLGPGLQTLAPNPVGTFKKYAGKRPRLEERIKKAPHTFFHAIVGEREYGDVFGAIRLRGLRNLHLETVKNAGHGVTDYLGTKRGIRQALHHYLDGLKGDGLYLARLMEGRHRWNAIDLDDKGNLTDYPQACSWLYAALIALAHPARKDHARMADKLTAMAEKEIPAYIKGYLHEMAARHYREAGDLDAMFEAGKTGLACNPGNSYLLEFMGLNHLWQKHYLEAWLCASQAISVKNTNMAQGIYRPNRCYDTFMEALNGLGMPELALESCDAWLLRRGMTGNEINAINAARRNSIEICRKERGEDVERYNLFSGGEAWRWQVLSQLWEWARDYGEAANALIKARSINTGNKAYALKVIDLYRAAGDDEAARKFALEEIVKGEWGPGYRRLAQICQAGGDLTAALGYAIRAREVERENHFHDLMLCELYTQLGECEKGRQYALPYIEDARLRPYALEQMANAAECAGDSEGAIAYLRQALECLPENASFQRRINALEKGESSLPSPSSTRSRPAVNAALEREALWFALDLEPESLSLRLRLAQNLRPTTFVGSLAALDEGLAANPDWEEGKRLREEITEAQRAWQEKHRKPSEPL